MQIYVFFLNRRRKKSKKTSLFPSRMSAEGHPSANGRNSFIPNNVFISFIYFLLRSIWEVYGKGMWWVGVGQGGR